MELETVVKTEAPLDRLYETLFSVHLSLDRTPGSPGVRLQLLLPGHRGLANYHWPTVQNKLTAAQIDDICVSVFALVSGALITRGVSRDVEPAES